MFNLTSVFIPRDFVIFTGIGHCDLSVRGSYLAAMRNVTENGIMASASKDFEKKNPKLVNEMEEMERENNSSDDEDYELEQGFNKSSSITSAVDTSNVDYDRRASSMGLSTTNLDLVEINTLPTTSVERDFVTSVPAMPFGSVLPTQLVLQTGVYGDKLCSGLLLCKLYDPTNRWMGYIVTTSKGTIDEHEVRQSALSKAAEFMCCNGFGTVKGDLIYGSRKNTKSGYSLFPFRWAVASTTCTRAFGTVVVGLSVFNHIHSVESGYKENASSKDTVLLDDKTFAEAIQMQDKSIVEKSSKKVKQKPLYKTTLHSLKKKSRKFRRKHSHKKRNSR